MPLRFPGRWRFEGPPATIQNASRIPEGAIQAFLSLIRRTATQGDLQEFLEHFKGFFSAANGTTHYISSNVGWAESDLQTQMSEAAANPPLFLEAMFDACEAIRRRPGGLSAPDAEVINRVCRENSVPYEIQGTDLVLLDPVRPVVAVAEPPPTLAEQAQNILQSSLSRSDELLSQGHGREAVQELLWLLETVSTAFHGLETESGTIEGKYFNEIVEQLRRKHRGTTLDRVLKWADEVHGYLSSPTGGGVRHGLDINEGVSLTLNEARLFCNLIRTFLVFLLGEHERLSRSERRGGQ